MKKIVFLTGILFFCGTLVHADYTIKKAKAVMYNQNGKKIGVVHLIETKEGVELKIHVSKLSPGQHGFHFHEAAKCDGPDFKTTGGHFNPEHKQHGMENAKGWHAGDLANMEVKENGKAEGILIDDDVTLGPGSNSLFQPEGTSLVIHADRDDYKTDPSGNSGTRIACGLVEPD